MIGAGKVIRVGGFNLSTLSSSILGIRQGGLDTLMKPLFSNGEQGFAYDPNDLATLYQDSLGTTPVTGAVQPVGLMLDKSKGLLLGDELVSVENSTFTDGTGDWVAYDSSISTVDGALLVDAQKVNGGAKLSLIGLKVGQAYVVRCDAMAGTSSAAQITLDFNGVVSTTESTFTPVKGIFFALTSDAVLTVLSGSSGTFYIDNVSVKELAGNHAYQTGSASRPILQRNATTGAYYLAFDGVDDSLQTNNIDFTATDKVSLFTGVTKLADNGQIIAEISPDPATDAGSYSLVAGIDNGGNGYVSLARGSSNASAGQSARNFTYLAPDVAVLSIKHDISGDLSSMRRNGVIGIDGLQDKGEGNFGNYPLFIGRRAGTSFPFNGHLYGLIGIGRLTTDSETIALEKSIAKNTGVTLNV